MFYFDNFYGKKILKSSLLAEEDCFFTTRDFVLTPANREDLISVAEQNRKFLIDKMSVKNITTCTQTHSDNIATVCEGKYSYENTDALISNIGETLLLMNFADCVPIILYSVKHNIGAIVHAGWRGTAQNIVGKTVKKIVSDFNISANDITALIGPSIGLCCFETNEDVFLKLVMPDFDYDDKIYEKCGLKYKIDLKLLNKLQLKKNGVNRIDICDYCTSCMSDLFFSYRKEKGITARHSAIVKIKGDKRCL